MKIFYDVSIYLFFVCLFLSQIQINCCLKVSHFLLLQIATVQFFVSQAGIYLCHVAVHVLKYTNTIDLWRSFIKYIWGVDQIMELINSLLRHKMRLKFSGKGKKKFVCLLIWETTICCRSQLSWALIRNQQRQLLKNIVRKIVSC